MNSQFLLQNRFAEAYGAGTYQCGSYSEGCTTSTGTGQPGGPLAPDTGLFAQPAVILYPTLLGVAVVIGTITYLISRQIKKLRQK